MTIAELTIFLIVLGFLPWRISRHTVIRRKRCRTCWQIQAIFWRLAIGCAAQGHHHWQFTAPFIQRLSTAIWSALEQTNRKVKQRRSRH